MSDPPSKSSKSLKSCFSTWPKKFGKVFAQHDTGYCHSQPASHVLPTSMHLTGNEDQVLPLHDDTPQPLSHNVPTLTQSTYDNPDISASVLARGKVELWALAARHNGCNLITNPRPVPILATFTIKYPHCLADPKFTTQVQWFHKRRDKVLGIESLENSYQNWVNGLQQDQFEDDIADPYELNTLGQTLLIDWESSSIANHLWSKEVDICRGPSRMLELAFQLRTEGKHIIQGEKSLNLPAEPGQVIADLIAFMRIPGDWEEDLNLMDNQQVFYCGSELGKVITFAFEAKSNDSVAASHQLAWYLCSAQYQRYALGFEGPLFGATLIGDTLTIYASEWKPNNTVSIYPTKHKFSLATFSSFLTCYIFLCKIADHMAIEFEKTTKSWRDSAIQQKIQDAIHRPWLHSLKSSCKCASHGGGGVASAQDNMEFEEMENWGLSKDNHMAIDIEGGGLKGDLLTKANLQTISSDKNSSVVKTRH